MKKTECSWENEMMETEDQVLRDMQEEFRKRLQSRLQDKVKAREGKLGDVSLLKKKIGRSASKKQLRRDRIARD